MGTEDPQGGADQLLALPRGSLRAGVTSLTLSLRSSSLSTQRGRSPPGPGERGGPPMPSWKWAATLSFKATPPWRGQAQGQGQTLNIPLQVGNLGCQGKLANTSSWSHSCKPLMAEQSAGGSVGGRGPEHRRVPGVRQAASHLRAGPPGWCKKLQSTSSSIVPARKRPWSTSSGNRLLLAGARALRHRGCPHSLPKTQEEPSSRVGAPQHWAQKLFVGIGATAQLWASRAARW